MLAISHRLSIASPFFHATLNCLLLCCLLGLAACTGQRATLKTLPRGAAIAKTVQVPNSAVIRYYLPNAARQSRSYFAAGGLWMEPGKSLTDAAQDTLSHYFPEAKPFEFGSSDPYGLLFDLEPVWSFDVGRITSTLNYRVLADPNAPPLLTGSREFSTPYEGPISFYNAALRSFQLVTVEILNKLEPSAQKHPNTQASARVLGKQLANLKDPVSLGTGFYINADGQLLTANHVLNDCLVIQTRADGKDQDVSLRAHSNLLDLAVLESKKPTEKFLKFRKNQTLVLGEMVATVGFPLQGILAETPNLTRGNISAHSGMKGSLGLFQFSAPIQPGTSGGPIIAESGQILGTTTATLNSKYLEEKGILPQNVNFGLDAKHIVRFLNKHAIAFNEDSVEPSKNFQASNESAIAASVRVACYQ